jgi:hypothetical protein
MVIRTIAALALLLATAALPPKTDVVVYSAWSASGLQPGYTVVTKVKGSCWTNALTTDRPDAWRCMVRDDIYDPCFAAASGRVVACAEDPFNKRVLLVTLSKPLPKSENPTTRFLQPQGEPWGLRLVSGETCSFATGATDVAQGMRMNYECKGNDFIVGFADRSKPVWTAHSIVWPDKKHLKTVEIATAVF